MGVRWLLMLAGLLISVLSAADDHTRTLAASCAACHGTNGNSLGGTPVLAGLERNHFVLQMKSFKSGERTSTVMHHHAKGLTDGEIEQLADHFAAQKRVTTSGPMPLGGL
jgi:cytochrome c553